MLRSINSCTICVCYVLIIVGVVNNSVSSHQVVTDLKENLEESNRYLMMSNEIFTNESNRLEEIINAQRTSNNANDSEITESEEVKGGTYPYHAAIIRKKYAQKFGYMEEPVCSGSIIATTAVLTAAHCVANEIVIYVIAGMISLYNYGNNLQKRKSVKVDSHDRYDSKTKLNDIAIVFFHPRFAYNLYVQPMQIADKAPDVTAKCVVTGWGADYNISAVQELGILRAHFVKLNDSKYCKFHVEAFTSGMLCSRFYYNEFCHGDSGGPLVCHDKIQGILSYDILPFNNCSKGHVQVYTDVYYYHNWIEWSTKTFTDRSFLRSDHSKINPTSMILTPILLYLAT